MSQSSANRIIPKLRYNLHERRRLRNPEGSQGRHNKIRKTVTALFKYERIEMNYHRADESRGYAERLISDAIRYGDTHQPTMEMASYWLLEPQLVHKLFKVLVPRYENSGISYTKLWKAPNIYPGGGRPKCVLELRNNIFPNLGEDKSFNKNLIHNVLLNAARKHFEVLKTNKAAETLSTDTENKETQTGVKADAENAAAAAASSAAVDSAIESGSMRMVDKETEENITNDSANGSEVEERSSTATSRLEEDINKLEINEEKQNRSSHDEDKK